MRPFLFSLMSLAAVSCVSEPKARPEPAHSSASATAGPREVDLTAMVGKEVTAQEFLKECVAQTGMNVTYDAVTAKELGRTYIRWSDRARLQAPEFESLVGQLLLASGFEMSPIGPPELRVFSVKRLKR